MDKRLHVLFLCGWYPSRVSPNNGDFIQRHAEAVSLLHKVSIVHIISDKNNVENIEISHNKVNGIDTYIGYIKKTSNPILKAYRFYSTYKRIGKEIGGYDIIHLNELFPFGLFTFLQKKPFIVSEHWTGYHYPQSKNINFFRRKLSQKIAKKASFICPVSKDLENSMKAIKINGSFKVVPNVVDTNSFYPLNEKKDANFTILHVSNMVNEHKNVSGLIEAVSELTFDFKLIIIGENSSKFKTISDTLKITDKIDFIEHLPHKSIPEYMQEANVFVLFSNYENLPCVILESFSCGLPVITTNVGGISEFFPKEFGYLIEPNNKINLVESLNYIYKKPIKLSSKMHKYAVEHFSNESIAKQFTKLYQRAIS